MAPIRCLSPHQCAGPIDTGGDRANTSLLRAGLRQAKPTESPHASRRSFFFHPIVQSAFLCLCILCHTVRVPLRSEVLHQKLPPLNRKRVCLVPCFNPTRLPSKPRRRRAVLGSLTLAHHNAAENFATCSPHRHHRSAYRYCTWSNRSKLI